MILCVLDIMPMNLLIFMTPMVLMILFATQQKKHIKNIVKDLSQGGIQNNG